MLIEQHDRNFRYKLLKENSSLGDVFGKFEAHKEALAIQEYGVSETTLEQIFVRICYSLFLSCVSFRFSWRFVVVAEHSGLRACRQNQFAAQQEEETGPVRGMVQ